jgi:alpha-amylase
MLVASMGFKGIITEGAKHVLGWKSPDFVYNAATAPKLKLLLKNDKLSDDISVNFANTEWDEYPLTADKYIDWIASLPEDHQVVNLFLSMETFGEFMPRECGIFEFMRALPRFAAERGVGFMTPSEVVSKLKPVDTISIPYAISWADEARDTSAWKGNSLQKEALEKLYGIAERVNLCTDRRLKQDWQYLQASDHFYYMSTKNLADGNAHATFSPYDSPYMAFTNYMNVLADFIVRVNEQYPESIDNEELNSLLLTIRNQAQEIETLQKEVKQLRTNILNADDSNNEAAAAPVAETPKKVAAKKPAAKKTTEKKTTKAAAPATAPKKK